MAMPSATAPPATAPQPELPDELLEDIFLRLDDAADLARASAASTSFRRVVSGRGFLRRFRSLHSPPVLGFLDCSQGCVEFYQSQPPHRSAPAARAVAHSADFTFSFLSDAKAWRVCDACDGCVLLARNISTTKSRYIFDAFVVYDPLHRRHVQIPPIPDDLVASNANCGDKHADPFGVGTIQCVPHNFEAFLAPSGEEESETSLRVICIVVSRCKIAAFIYSSITKKWQWITSCGIESFKWMRYPTLLWRRCAHNCVFWRGFSQQIMLVLDTREMKFSFVVLPHESKDQDKIIVEAATGRFGLFILEECTLHLYTMTLQDNGVGAKDWRHDHSISLPKGYYWGICSGATTQGNNILLQGLLQEQYFLWRHVCDEKIYKYYFTVDVKTLLVKQLCVLKIETTADYLYASFPPPLSVPRV